MGKIIHGHAANRTSTPEYTAWTRMKVRCYDSMHDNYKSYGGRGITVCDRWLNSFANFLDDMGLRPSRKHSIERKNNDGIYEPSNCVWATQMEQSRNTRHNRRLTILGQELILTDAASKYGISKELLWFRLKSGMTPDAAVLTPVRQWNRRSIN